MDNEWKGNVRELEHVIEAAMNMVESGRMIELENLPAYLTMASPPDDRIEGISEENEISLTEAMEAYEKRLIINALSQSRWKIVDAAKKLKIPRTSLNYKMEKYGIKKDGNSSY